MEFVTITAEKVKNWEAAIASCAHAMSKKGYVKESYCTACVEREREFPTGLELGCGVAIPHSDPVHVNQAAICLLRLKDSVAFRRMDDPDLETPVQLVFALALNGGEDHRSTLSRIIKSMQNPAFLRCCLEESETEATAFLARHLMQ